MITLPISTVNTAAALGLVFDVAIAPTRAIKERMIHIGRGSGLVCLFEGFDNLVVVVASAKKDVSAIVQAGLAIGGIHRSRCDDCEGDGEDGRELHFCVIE